VADNNADNVDDAAALLTVIFPYWSTKKLKVIISVMRTHRRRRSVNFRGQDILPENVCIKINKAKFYMIIAGKNIFFQIFFGGEGVKGMRLCVHASFWFGIHSVVILIDIRI